MEGCREGSRTLGPSWAAMDRCVEEDGEFYAVQDQFPNVILPLREDHYVGPQVHSYMCQSWSNKGFEHRKTMCVCFSFKTMGR